MLYITPFYDVICLWVTSVACLYKTSLAYCFKCPCDVMLFFEWNLFLNPSVLMERGGKTHYRSVIVIVKGFKRVAARNVFLCQRCTAEPNLLPIHQPSTVNQAKEAYCTLTPPLPPPARLPGFNLPNTLTCATVRSRWPQPAILADRRIIFNGTLIKCLGVFFSISKKY